MKSIQTKIIIIFSAFFVLAVSTLVFFLYNNSKEVIEQTVGAQAKRIAENAVKVVEADRFEELLVEGDQGPYYSELRNQLNTIRETNGLLYLYTMAKREGEHGEEYIYVVDGMPLDDNEASSFGDSESIEEFPIIAEVFQTGEAKFGDITYSDEWGMLIYAYAPIKNRAGEIIGVVGSDFDVTNVADDLAKNRAAAILLTVVVSIISVLILYILTRLLIKPLKSLKNQVEKVKEGDLTVVFSGSDRNDEIGSLALAFQHMVNEMNVMINSINNNTQMLVRTSEVLKNNFQTIITSNDLIIQEMLVVNKGANSTVKSTDESSKAMEELTQGVQHIAETALQVNDASHTTVKDANLGITTIEQISAQMNSIYHSVQESADLVKNSDQYSVEIGKIVGVISAIA